MITAFALLATLLQAAPAPAPAPAAVPVSTLELPVQILDSKGEIPRALQAEDLTVIDAGQKRPIVSLSALSRPWRIVIYVDRVLTGSRTLRASAGTLAEQASRLAALGTVEVVVAEPGPRVAAGPTREVPLIDEALSKLWLENDGRDDVRILRQRFRDEKTEGGVDPADRATQAVEAEARLVRHQQDAFVEWLAAQGGDGPKVVLLISDGFDIDPARFYRGPLAEGEGALEKTAAETARTTAALGWTVYPMPVGDSTLPDLRKVRPRSTPQVPLGGTITLGRKNPEENQPPPPPVLLAPREPLNFLAEATGGEVLLQPSEVPATLARLAARFVLRYDAPQPLDGRPRALEVISPRQDLKVKTRRWDVEGLPEWIAAERAGRVADGEEEVGLEISTHIQKPAAVGEPGALDLRIESPEVPAGPLRVTVAGPGGRGAFHHILTDADRAGSEPNVYHLPVTLPEGADTVAVLVEPLAGGVWGGQAITLSGPPPEVPAISVTRPGIRLVAPTGSGLAGKVRLRVNGEGAGIARVDLKLGDRTAASCGKVPCEAEVDLGRRVRPQIVQGVAYGADGKELARDWVRLNDPNQGFGVRIVAPAGRQGVGPVDVEADVRAPAGRRVEKVEIYWNDELAATLYAPPFRHRVNVPRNRPIGYLRVTAHLDDGSTAEDSMSLNTTELGTHIDVRLVQLAVVVTDANGKPVPGLPKEAFQLRQDGQEQEIAAFENAGELPLSVALAIDTSASMFLKLPDVRKAVGTLLNTGLTERDRAMLIDFDSQAKLVRPLTRDLGAVVAALDQLQPDGGTALWGAILFSLRQLQGISGRKALVMYSDGIDETEHAAYPAALKAARESGVPIYLIVSNPREERGEDGGFLSEPAAAKFQRIAAAGGGQVYFIHPNQDLAGVYGQILSELRSQYTLAFYPKDTAPPAAWSKIEVEVKGQKGLTARTVSGVAARP